jgi:tetratricopeptide (TPR) repeat protein
MKRPATVRARARRLGGALTSLAAGLASVAGLSGVAGLVGPAVWPPPAAAQSESLINRISNEQMQKFEDKLTAQLNAALSRYLARRQYVLAVKVVWNPNVMPAVRNPQQSPEQQKLPGFPIFVRAPDSPATDEGTPPFVRLEVRVLIDETLPEYYERFVRKLVPIVARMDFNRGDQVVVLKETFPVRPKDEEEPPPTLPEKELMQQLGTTPPPGQLPPRQPGAFSPQSAVSPAEAAQEAYDEGRYADALRIVESSFQSATTNQERGYYLGIEGSIFYTQGNKEAAKAAWRRAISYDPSNMEVQKVLTFMESQPGGPQQ